MDVVVKKDILKIGNRIRNRRMALGLTQDGLADQLNVHPRTLSRIELGQLRKMNLLKLNLIASAIGLNLGEVLKDTSFDVYGRNGNSDQPKVPIPPSASVWLDVANSIDNFPMVLTSTSGYIILANKVFIEMFGYDEKTLPFCNLLSWLYVAELPRSGGKHVGKIIPLNSAPPLKCDFRFTPLNDELSLSRMLSCIIIPHHDTSA